MSDRTRRWFLLCAIGWGVLLTRCGSKSAPPLLIFAAISTAEPLSEMAASFEKETHQQVSLSLGASSDLARQIIAGAPADLFLSADSAQMERLVREGLVLPGARTDLLSNQLAVIVPSGSSARISQPTDLLPIHRLALADPEAVPLGVYARKWLESRGLWKQLSVIVVPTLDARATLAAVETESAEAGIVYRTDAIHSKRARIVLSVPPEEGPSIVYPLAVLTRSQHPAATRFARYLHSAAAQTVFERHGFAPAR